MLSSFEASRGGDGKPAFVTGVKHLGEHRPAQIAGSFPLLARGWALLDADDPLVHPDLPHLRPGILNSLWVTLKQPEGERLGAMIQSGEI